MVRKTAISVGGDTVASRLTYWAHVTPNAVAIEALDRAPLTYAGLVDHMDRTRRTLRSFGIGPTDRVAVVLDDGPEAALALLSIAACAVVAPLNPACRAAKLEYYFTDLPARAVVVAAGSGGEAADVARSLGTAVIEISRRNDHAGVFDLSCACGTPAMPLPSEVGPHSVALLLYTSGTTGRPKLVPLTHANICASAESTAAALQLGPNDRCLHIVPSSTSTAWWERCWPRWRRGERSCARRAFNRPASWSGLIGSLPLGTPLFQRCTERSYRRQSSGDQCRSHPRCVSCDRFPPRSRHRCCSSSSARSAFRSSRATA